MYQDPVMRESVARVEAARAANVKLDPRRMTAEEKDQLLEEYGMIHCSGEQLAALNQKAIIGRKSSSYGTEAIVKRDAVPEGMSVSPISIEDLFVFMVKEGK